jgi:copper chaperone
MTQARIAIEGMHCAACVRRVQAALSGVSGVVVNNVEVGSAEVAFDESKTSLEQIRSSLTAIGFEPKT